MGDIAIRNIVFDFGGVVVGYDPAAWVKSLYGTGEAYGYIMENLFGSELWRKLDLGLAAREEANAEFYEKAREDGFGAEMRYALDNWFENVMDTKTDTVALIRGLREKGYGVYYLTNMPRDLWAEFGRRGLRDLFDGGVASFEVHVTKPDRKIYSLLLDACHLRPGETILFDDTEQNVSGAIAAGMDAEVFTDARDARKKLRERGVEIDV